VASQLPKTLWPVAGESVLQRLLISLAKQGLQKAIVCSNGDTSLLRRSVCLESNHNINVEFLDEPLPVGTAGCIRDAVGDDSGRLLLVLPACIVNPPKIEPLLQAHLSSKSDLTVVLNPDTGNPADIYICSSSLKKLIPKQGYFDIKEGLIPAMLSDGKAINTVTVPGDVGNFHDWQQYLYAVSGYLQSEPDLNGHLTLKRSEKTNVIFKAESANIESGARLYGHVVVMDKVHLPGDSVIFGPTILGRNVKVGKNTTIVNSIIWDDVQIGDNCLVRQSVISRGAQVTPGSTLTEQAVSIKQYKLLSNMTAKAATASKKIFSPLMAKVMNNNKSTIDGSAGNQSLLAQKNFPVLLGIGLLLAAFVWSYWPGILDLWGVWQRSDEYSSGLLVPFLAFYILWSRRDELAGCQLTPSVWGIVAFLGAQCVRI
jgi:NDP-sugar pyrophosphorylase family protein